MKRGVVIVVGAILAAEVGQAPFALAEEVLPPITGKAEKSADETAKIKKSDEKEEPSSRFDMQKLKETEPVFDFIDRSDWIALGRMYEERFHDKRQAFKYYYEAAQAGDAEGQFRLAALYESFRNKDNDRIVSWLKKAAAQGHLEAQFALGKIYHFGRKGVLPDLREAVFWYRKAAEQGDKEALRNMDLILASEPVKGKVTGDDKWDLQWHKKFAQSGDAESMYELAKALETGAHGVKVDYAEAKRLYEEAAKKGYIEAQCRLAQIFLKVGKEYEAFYWYEQASLMDYALAQKKLAEFYRDGTGCEKDLEKSYLWLYLSVTSMFPYEEEGELFASSPELEAAASSLSKEQREKVMRQAEPFIQKMRPYALEK